MDARKKGNHAKAAVDGVVVIDEAGEEDEEAEGGLEGKDEVEEGIGQGSHEGEGVRGSQRVLLKGWTKRERYSLRKGR